MRSPSINVPINVLIRVIHRLGNDLPDSDAVRIVPTRHTTTLAHHPSEQRFLVWGSQDDLKLYTSNQLRHDSFHASM